MDTPTLKLVRAVLWRLETELPPQFVAYGLPVIAEFLRYDPGLLAESRAPQLWVRILEKRPAAPASIGGANAHRTSERRLFVGMTMAGDDAADTMDSLTMAGDLIEGLVLSDQRAGGEGSDVVWLGTRYSENFARGTRLFAAAGLTFAVKRWTGMDRD